MPSCCVEVFWCYEGNENYRSQVKFLLQFLFVEFRSWRYQSTDFSLSPVSCNQLNPKIRREYSILQKKRYDLSRGCRHCFIFLTFTISSSVKILLWQALPASNGEALRSSRFNTCFGHRRAFWTLIQVWGKFRALDFNARPKLPILLRSLTLLRALIRASELRYQRGRASVVPTLAAGWHLNREQAGNYPQLPCQGSSAVHESCNILVL